MENKKNLSVTLEVKELMYDAMNKTYLTGKAREADQKGQNYESASNMQASEDDENSYQLRRSMANAFSSLKSLLGEYLDEECSTSNNKVDEKIDGDGQLTLGFKLPSNYNNASADALGNNLHAYIVDVMVAEWFTITNPGDAQVYAQHSILSLENAKRALYKRSRPSRPQYT